MEAAVEGVDLLIAPSGINLYRHRQLGLRTPMVHLPNFVPPTGAAVPASDPADGEIPEGPYFLFVGRLEKLKGLRFGTWFEFKGTATRVSCGFWPGAAGTSPSSDTYPVGACRGCIERPWPSSCRPSTSSKAFPDFRGGMERRWS